VAVEGLPGARRYGARTPAEPVKAWWLVGPAAVGWALVGTMPFWWAWLWQRLGLISVPVDTTVWIVAVIPTVLSTPILWRRFHHAWVVVTAVAALVIGGTTIVMWPWHDVFTKAWVRMECGTGDCATTPPPTPYTWRVVKPK
jgi:hypothetical protein